MFNINMIQIVKSVKKKKIKLEIVKQWGHVIGLPKLHRKNAIERLLVSTKYNSK